MEAKVLPGLPYRIVEMNGGISHLTWCKNEDPFSTTEGWEKKKEL